jgi:hypothetical protein
MVHHIVLCKFYPEVGDDRIEWVMRQTRIRLLKIPEVRVIKCGKQIEAGNLWGFFFGVDYESMNKMAEGRADPIYQHFVEEVIYPYVSEQIELSYEMEPGRDVRYS